MRYANIYKSIRIKKQAMREHLIRLFENFVTKTIELC